MTTIKINQFNYLVINTRSKPNKTINTWVTIGNNHKINQPQNLILLMYHNESKMQVIMIEKARIDAFSLVNLNAFKCHCLDTALEVITKLPRQKGHIWYIFDDTSTFPIMEIHY